MKGKFRSLKKKAEEKKAEAQKPEKPEGIAKREPKGEPVQPAKDEKKPEEKPAGDAGRVATPVEEGKPVRSTYESFEPEDRETVPEEERPTVSAPEPAETMQDTIVSSTPRTPEQVEKDSEPDTVLENVVDKAIKARKYDEALNQALKIKNKEIRYQLIERVADKYAEKGEFSEAEKIAENIEDKLVRSRVVMEFAIITILDLKSEIPKEVDDPKLFDKAERILKNARDIAREAPEGKPRANSIKEIDSALDKVQGRKNKSYKYNQLKKRRKRIMMAAAGAVGTAAAVLVGLFGEVFDDELKALFNGKAKTEQVSTDKKAQVEIALLKLQQEVMETRLGVLDEGVDLLEPIGKSTGLYEGEFDEEGELIEAKELDYTKLYGGFGGEGVEKESLVKGEIRKFEDIDKDIAEAVNETEMKEQLDEIDGVDFEGETELTELDRVMKKLELIDSKLEELSENGGQTDENLGKIKKLLEEKKQLLKLEKILANYKQGYTDDFCGVIRIDLQETTCEEDQWVVIRDKNELDLRFIVYDEPTDCPDDCPTGTRKKAPPKKIKVKGFGTPQAPGT